MAQAQKHPENQERVAGLAAAMIAPAREYNRPVFAVDSGKTLVR